MLKKTLTPVEWFGSSKEDLKSFPDPSTGSGGFCSVSGTGWPKAPRCQTPLRGLGFRVLEVVSRHDGDTYRAVYTVRFKAAVYVLHAFQKKAKRGIETPKQDIDLIKSRLKVAERHYKETYDGG